MGPDVGYAVGPGDGAAVGLSDTHTAEKVNVPFAPFTLSSWNSKFLDTWSVKVMVHGAPSCAQQVIFQRDARSAAHTKSSAMSCDVPYSCTEN